MKRPARGAAVLCCSKGTKRGNTSPKTVVHAFDCEAAARFDWPREAAPYPDDNPKTIFGIAKPSLHAIPPVALVWLGAAMEEGRQKYGLTNWRDKPVTASTYLNAAFRHLLCHIDGEDLDPESPNGRTPHLAKAMACFAIVLDAQAQGTLNDDRGTAGNVSTLIAELTKK